MAHVLPALVELTSLSGKTALITGAANGIGRTIAYRYAEAGATIIALDRDEKALGTLQSELARFDAGVTTHVVDLMDNKAIADFWAQLTNLPDILVNNAGIFVPTNFIDADLAFIERTMQINLTSVIVMCQEFITRRIKKGGTIINISSIEAKTAFKKDMSIYAVSKAAVLALTHSIASEYGHKGFKVNVILPGGINTPGAYQLGINAIKQLKLSIITEGIQFQKRVPMGRFGEPDDIAKVALFLASSMSDYMQGAELIVDGGFMVA